MGERSRRRIRDLVTQLAFKGLSENEIGCVRISMVARSDLLHQRAGYRRARPVSATYRFSLQRTAGPYSRVTSVALCDRRPSVKFRYATLATEIARHRNVSRRPRRKYRLITSWVPLALGYGRRAVVSNAGHLSTMFPARCR